MAIGVPRKRTVLSTLAFPSEDMVLSYPGKTPLLQVLQTAPASVRAIYRAGRTNGFYFGENLRVLAHLMKDPEVCGKVRLVYIDPPFATQTVFHSRSLKHAYEDVLSGSRYIEFIRQRLILLRELLAEDGSIYLHLDAKMVFHVKQILDEVFGAGSFRNCITRKKCNPKNYTRKQFGNVADYILFYTKTQNYIWNKPVEPWTEGRDREYRYIDEKSGRRFMKVPVHAPGVRNGETGKPWQGMVPPPGKHWQYPPATLDEMDARGEIYWSPNGNPRRKVFLDESDGVGVQDIWMDFKDAHNQNICITGYPTEKNPDLLARIVQASSNPGDLVLDCFSGSGTTLAVADELNRRWIGVDCSPEAFTTMLRRFHLGVAPMGDFVSTRKSKRTPPIPALFAEYETNNTLQVSTPKQRKITNFALYSDAELEPLARVIALRCSLSDEDNGQALQLNQLSNELPASTVQKAETPSSMTS
ncbi:site-specific DNA-methyltransferase [Edaphobacter sp.]|uniref:site-specific DNA-methyltransferase n=1 Tax=Edaphobacter sp. TaxID=1934404 RepID=UPI002DBC1064|nr:site-specific DNA-methyltransferase [Edaphobacter sp.]HEU5341089.1 site-specific DNA-methyltransferase [Edaphobacter sp.]